MPAPPTTTAELGPISAPCDRIWAESAQFRPIVGATSQQTSTKLGPSSETRAKAGPDSAELDVDQVWPEVPKGGAAPMLHQNWPQSPIGRLRPRIRQHPPSQPISGELRPRRKMCSRPQYPRNCCWRRLESRDCRTGNPGRFSAKCRPAPVTPWTPPAPMEPKPWGCRGRGGLWNPSAQCFPSTRVSFGAPQTTTNTTRSNRRPRRPTESEEKRATVLRRRARNDQRHRNGVRRGGTCPPP